MSQASKQLLGLRVRVACMSEATHGSGAGTSLGAGACTLLSHCLHVLIGGTCFSRVAASSGITMQPALSSSGAGSACSRTAALVSAPHISKHRTAVEAWGWLPLGPLELAVWERQACGYQVSVGLNLPVTVTFVKSGQSWFQRQTSAGGFRGFRQSG